MERYAVLSDENIYGKFIDNNGAIKVNQRFGGGRIKEKETYLNY